MIAGTPMSRSIIAKNRRKKDETNFGFLQRVVLYKEE